jgi:DNA-binding HxlR family transcriptional regulator
MSADTAEEWQRTWHQLQQALGNKWALHVLHVIAEGECSFTDLKQRIDGISDTMLSRRLSDLQEKGFVQQSTSPSTLPRKRYELTGAGERVARFLNEMESITAIAEAESGPQLVFETS